MLLLGTPPRSSSLGTSPPPAPRTSGPTPPAARLPRYRSSIPPPVTPSCTLRPPSLTFRVSQTAPPDTPPGSVPTTVSVRAPSRTTSRRSTPVTSQSSPTTVAAPLPPSTPTFVRELLNHVIIAWPLINALIRSRLFRNRLPLRCLLERPCKRYQFQGWNAYPPGFPLHHQRWYRRLRLRSVPIQAPGSNRSRCGRLQRRQPRVLCGEHPRANLNTASTTLREGS